MFILWYERLLILSEQQHDTELGRHLMIILAVDQLVKYFIN